MITTIGKQVGKKAIKVEAPILEPANNKPKKAAKAQKVPEVQPWGESPTVWAADRDEEAK